MIAIDSQSEVEQYLNRLHEETTPQWGQMSPQQMIEHLSYLLRIGTGEITLPLHTREEKLPAYRASIATDNPMPQNWRFPAYTEGLPPLQHENLQQAKQALLKDLRAFMDFFQAHPHAQPLHPVFGHINRDEWFRLQQKHFDHHFRQFGLK